MLADGVAMPPTISNPLFPLLSRCAEPAFPPLLSGKCETIHLVSMQLLAHLSRNVKRLKQSWYSLPDTAVLVRSKQERENYEQKLYITVFKQLIGQSALYM